MQFSVAGQGIGAGDVRAALPVGELSAGFFDDGFDGCYIPDMQAMVEH